MRPALSLVTALILSLAVAPLALAHQLGADCALRGDKVEVEAFYDDDTPARQARVTVKDAAEKIVAEGRTDDKGRWRFSTPKAGRYSLTIDAGSGHRATVHLTVPAPLVARLAAVGAEGKGNVEASEAYRALIKSGPESLLPVLHTMNDAGPAAGHWLRSAVDCIAEQALESRKALPVKQLEAFIRDKRHAPRVRFLAYGWLVRADSSAPGRLLPGMLDDSAPELRREAVAAVIVRAEEERSKGSRSAAVATLRRALSAARDRDQIEEIVAVLEKQGVKVDLARQFGFVRRWMLLGPLPDVDGKGLAKSHPVEERIDFAAAFKGKDDRPVRWQEHRTTDDYGVVDLAKPLGEDRAVIGYACAVVEASREQAVEVRVGSNNAVQVFLNGKRVVSRAIGHQGMRMDQNVGRGVLKAGRNQILVKVHRDDHVRFSKQWSFQLRLCDCLGGAVSVAEVAAVVSGSGGKRP